MSRCKSLVLFVGNSQLNIQTAESCGVSVNVFNEKFPWLAHIDKQTGAAGVRLLLKQGSGRESEALTSMFDTLMCLEVLNKTIQFRYECLGSILGTDWGAHLSKSNLDDFFFQDLSWDSPCGDIPCPSNWKLTSEQISAHWRDYTPSTGMPRHLCYPSLPGAISCQQLMMIIAVSQVHF